MLFFNEEIYAQEDILKVQNQGTIELRANEEVKPIKVGLKLLKILCKSIAVYYPKIGYCQGLNYPCALVLLVSGGDLEASFNIMKNLMAKPRYMMALLYNESFMLLSVFKFLFEKIIIKKDKEL